MFIGKNSPFNILSTDALTYFIDAANEQLLGAIFKFISHEI